eukprot:GEZU01002802.1.p1 GENE.GEZU01002802.1~~GEZU01002802.1.p1  ORF type:complete len:154 (-),score=40.48 GEZU01002802.1:190-651(-)
MLWDMFSRGTTTTTTTTTMTATALSARNNTTSADPVTNKLSSRGHNKTYDDFQRVVQEVQAYHPDDDVTHDNEPSMITALLVYANYAMLILFGYIEEWIGKYLLRKKYNVTQEVGKPRQANHQNNTPPPPPPLEEGKQLRRHKHQRAVIVALL